ncbi:MAG TPA: zinc ribbon domain-containing protein [Candidatus Ozemobacteraceae bacterium]|nr:zinc ribbon domain-containing protein [Candidatus Ozemobacteraceae bacterium]
MKRRLILTLMVLLLTTGPAFALFCSQCGHNLADDANFCSSCGKACRDGSSSIDTSPVPTVSPSAPPMVQPVQVVTPIMTTDVAPAYLVTSPYLYLNSQRLDRHHPIRVLEVRGSQARVMFVSNSNPCRPISCWVTIGDLERHTTWRPQFQIVVPGPAPFCFTRSPKRRPIHAPVVVVDHKRKHRHDKHDRHGSTRVIFKL